MLTAVYVSDMYPFTMSDGCVTPALNLSSRAPQNLNLPVRVLFSPSLGENSTLTCTVTHCNTNDE